MNLIACSQKYIPKCCLSAFHMTLIKLLRLQMSIASRFITYSSVLLALFTGFFQKISDLKKSTLS